MNETTHPGLLEHALIDRAFRSAIDAAKHGTPDELLAPVLELVNLVRAHIDAEEEDLTSYAVEEPDEAEALSDEHAAIRDELDVLVAAARKKELLPAQLFAFKARFSIHEAREERGFYKSGRIL